MLMITVNGGLLQPPASVQSSCVIMVVLWLASTHHGKHLHWHKPCPIQCPPMAHLISTVTGGSLQPSLHLWIASTYHQILQSQPSTVVWHHCLVSSQVVAVRPQSKQPKQSGQSFNPGPLDMEVSNDVIQITITI